MRMRNGEMWESVDMLPERSMGNGLENWQEETAMDRCQLVHGHLAFLSRAFRRCS